jgi:hypothetical protein
MTAPQNDKPAMPLSGFTLVEIIGCWSHGIKNSVCQHPGILPDLFLDLIRNLGVGLQKRL